MTKPVKTRSHRPSDKGKSQSKRNRAAKPFKRMPQKSQLEVRRFSVQHEGRPIDATWTLIRFSSRSAGHNIALRFGTDGVRAYSLRHRDPRELRAKLEAAGLRCVSVANATNAIRNEVFGALLVAHCGIQPASKGLEPMPIRPVSVEAVREVIRAHGGAVRGYFGAIATKDQRGGVIVLHDYEGAYFVRIAGQGAEGLALQILDRLDRAANAERGRRAR